jgi:alkylhydroperoxidase family enzyme
MSTQRLTPVDPAAATGKTKELLDFVQQRTGRIPNMVRLMANSPAALGAYLALASAFRDGVLASELRDLIAEASGCDYTLSAVCTLARGGGRADSDIAAARRAEAGDAKTATALRFAVRVVEKQGHVADADVAVLRAVGFTDGEIAEIVAVVILNLYRSYFNLVARPEVDFPLVTTAKSP